MLKMERTLELMKIERECLMRNIKEQCDRNCGECDLVQDFYELLEAYNTVIFHYESMVKHIASFIKYVKEGEEL